MIDSDCSAVHQIPQPVRGEMSRGALSQRPLTIATLGSWGLAHLTGAWSADGHPRLVGRELESIRLLHTLDEVLRERSPAVVTISAPAGMGKTRLIEETLVLARVSGFEQRIFSVAALPTDERGALLGRLLRARFGLDADADAATQCATLLAQVRDVLHDERVADVCLFLGKLLGLEFEGTPLSRALSHDAFHAELAVESILCDLFSADATQAPICFVFEDLQHADADSLALLMALLDGIGGAVLTLCSARPEFFARHEHFSQFSAAHHEHLDLSPLERSDVRALMRQMLGPEAANEVTLEQYIVEAGLGNPGLMRRLTSELWERGALENDGDRVAPSFRPERLPPTPDLDEQTEVVETRLHGLPDEQRQALEAAAIVGSTCWAGLWARLMRTTAPRLAHLDVPQLMSASMISARTGHLLKLPDSRIDGETEYVFKRANERDLLLRQLTPTKRRACHRVIADWLIDSQSVRLSSDLTALLARHLAGSGSTYRAALAHLDAGDLARREGSGAQAAIYFRLGLADLGEHDNRRRVDALHSYGAILAELGRPGPARVAFSAMLDLADQLGLPSKQGAALNRLGRVHRDSGELEQARRCFERARAAFEMGGDARGLSATKDDLGKLLWLEGDHLAALPLLRSGLEERKVTGDRRSLAVSLANVALVWEEQGKSAVAAEALGIAYQLFGTEQDERGCCDTMLGMGRVATHRHDLPRAEQYFQSAVALATAAADHSRLARSLVHLGETKLRANNLDAAEPLLLRACVLAEGVEAWLDLAEAKRALAKLQLKSRRLTDARKSIRVSLHLARRARSRSQLAATLRTLAEIAAAGAWSASTEGRAVGYYMFSIELAKQTNNELELAKGYRSFARYADRYDRPEIKQQATILRDLSDEIFQRHEVRS